MFKYNKEHSCNKRIYGLLLLKAKGRIKKKVSIMRLDSKEVYKCKIVAPKISVNLVQ